MQSMKIWGWGWGTETQVNCAATMLQQRNEKETKLVKFNSWTK